MYKIQSSIYGKIKKILIMIPDATAIGQGRYAGLFNSFREIGVDFVIYAREKAPWINPIRNKLETQNDLKRDIRAIMDKENCTDSEKYSLIVQPEIDFGELLREPLQELQAYLPPDAREIDLPTILNNSRMGIDEWAQDPFVVLKKEGQPSVFLEPFYFNNFSNQYIAEHVAEEVGMLLKSTSLDFQGGNLLAGDNFLLAGISIKQTFDQRNASSYSQGATTTLRANFGIDQIIWIGNEETGQALFHIDLFLTLGGKTSDGKELVFVGELWTEEEGELVLAHDSSNRRALTLAQHLDDTANYLTEYDGPGPNFMVARLPIYRERLSGRLLSFNNCLIENWCDNKKRVFLPLYKRARFESPTYPLLAGKARDILEEWGYEVNWVSGPFWQSSGERGSLHCMVKVLEREE